MRAFRRGADSSRSGALDYDTLLLFDWDDGVSAVRTVGARDDVAAIEAAFAQMTLPRCAGYQLWRASARVARTFPAEAKTESRPRVRLNN